MRRWSTSWPSSRPSPASRTASTRCRASDCWASWTSAKRCHFILIIFLLVFALTYRTIHSPFGEVLKAIRENEPHAISLDYRVERYKLLAFALSATLSGVAGAIFVASVLLFRRDIVGELETRLWGHSRRAPKEPTPRRATRGRARRAKAVFTVLVASPGLSLLTHSARESLSVPLPFNDFALQRLREAL